MPGALIGKKITHTDIIDRTASYERCLSARCYIMTSSIRSPPERQQSARWRYGHRSYPVPIHVSCQCVCTPFFSRHDRRTAPKYCTQIWDSFAPKQIGPTYGPEDWAHWEQISEIGLWRRMRQRRPRSYSMELPPASEFAFFRLI